MSRNHVQYNCEGPNGSYELTDSGSASRPPAKKKAVDNKTKKAGEALHTSAQKKDLRNASEKGG